MKYVGNAFSLQMVDDGYFKVTTITKKEFDKEKKDAKSIMGHPDMAYVHGCSYNRETIKMSVGDVLIVAQVISGRLPEGIKYLPPDVKIGYKKVEIVDVND